MSDPCPVRARLLVLLVVVLGAGCRSATVDEQTSAAAVEANGPSTSTAPAGEAPTPATPATMTPPPAPSDAESFGASPWPDRAHGQQDGTASTGGRPVRFEPPTRREPGPPRGVPERPRLGLVVVRGGVIVHDPTLLLDLEGRLDGAVAAVVVLAPGRGDGGSIGLEALAGLGRTAGLDLVLVDVRQDDAPREGWLVATSSRELVGAFAAPAEAGRLPSSGHELVPRIERAWIALQ